MKRSVLTLAAALVTSTAGAETITIGCPVVHRYSEAEVNVLLSQARSVLNDQEIGHIYGRYVALKTACQTNANASRTVTISGGLRSWLAQRGIDVTRLAKL
ncbi:MAG TPA: hypothetical protein VK446_12160 [Methylocystis sp.]|nr:hypothetical protein [Methylocystis sp.]